MIGSNFNPKTTGSSYNIQELDVMAIKALARHQLLAEKHKEHFEVMSLLLKKIGMIVY